MQAWRADPKVCHALGLDGLDGYVLQLISAPDQTRPLQSRVLPAFSTVHKISRQNYVSWISALAPVVFPSSSNMSYCLHAMT
jgi:hypothetical protein